MAMREGCAGRRACGEIWLRFCRDNPFDLRDAARAGVDVRRPQLGRQQMPAAEHVQRQIAVAVVIAVEEAPLLMPVQRVVGGVEIEDDLLRRSLVRLKVAH